MKNKATFFLLLLILGGFAFAQHFKYQAIYHLKYTPDSLQKTNFLEEDFILFLDDKKSVFESIPSYKRDSAFSKLKELPDNFSTLTLGMSMVNNLPKTRFLEVVEKDRDRSKTIYLGNVGPNFFYYEEKDNPLFNWKLSGEEKPIGNLQCQKATTSFGGRNWIVWFAKEIPFSDGPYKFSGLPGLIVEVYDDKENYHYSLTKFSEMKGRFYETMRKNYVKTTKEKYFKTYKTFTENPEAYLRANMESHGIKSVSSDGKDNFNNINQRWKKRNNPIELIP